MYRDEHEAAKGRVAALEREVAELKEQLRELRDELEAARDERDRAMSALRRPDGPARRSAEARARSKDGRAPVYCPVCGAGNQRGALGCTSCGETLWHHGQNTPRCPACRDQPLRESDDVWGCVRCGGHWLGDAHFRRLVEMARSGRSLPLALYEDRPMEMAVRRRATMCPRCSQVMQRRPYGQAKVVVDVCPQRHGVFFDGGELIQALRWEHLRQQKPGERDPLGD